MVEKISVQIALEGGAEVQRQLEGIGEAGQKAFEEISKSAEQVGGFKNLKPEEVTTKLKELGIEGSAAFDKIQQAVNKAVKFEKIVTGVQAIEDEFASLARIAGPIVAGIGAAFAAAVKPTIAFAEALNKASDAATKLGLSLDQFKGQQRNLQDLGLTADQAGQALTNFQKQLARGIAAADPGSNLRLFGSAVDASGQQMQSFLDRLGQMPDGLERTNQAIQALGESAGTAFIQGLRRAEGSMTSTEAKAYDLGQAFQRLSTAISDLGSVTLAPAITAGLNEAIAVVQALGRAINDLGTAATATFGSLTSPIEATKQELIGIGSALTSLGSIFASAFSGVSDPIQNTARELAAIGEAITNAASAVVNFASSIAGITWDQIASAGVRAWNAITQAIQNAIDAVMRYYGLKSDAGIATPTTGSGSGGFAGGGIIGGRGTGTSDSNLAWVSRGEHIMPARAVAQPGVLAFLEALRRSGGNLEAVLAGMGRFALGSLVPRPAFAAGGPVGSMSHVTIQFPGVPPVTGLRASVAVVDQLQKAAALAQVRSGGRKPSRYS